MVHFGFPGDTITNLIDWDGDSLDDFLVVRTGPANEFGDGQSYLHWLAALSAFGEAVVDTVFGVSGDRVFTFYSDGFPRMGVVRISTSGECLGQFEWYSLNFSIDPAGRLIDKRCWGLPGDIPLPRVDYNNNDKADWIVVRPTDGIQVAYVLFDDEQEFTTVPLGLSSAIPQMGNFKNEGVTFAWSQRDQGLVGIRNADNTDDIFPFGIEQNTIVRADGTVVVSSSSDRLEASGSGDDDDDGGGGEILECGTTAGSGFLYKPASQDSGGTREGYPMVLLSRYSSNESCGEVLASNGQVISRLPEADPVTLRSEAPVSDPFPIST